MKSLSQSFLKLSTTYQGKREKFKHALDRMKRKGQLDLFQKASTLFENAEIQLHNLKAEFSVVSDGQINALRSKVKSFKKTYKELNEITKPELQQWIEAVVTALFLAVILRNFIFGLYHVPTGSAEPNILVGDRIWGNKMAYYISDVKHGDLVIFDNPEFVYDTSNSFKYYWQKYVGFAIPLLGLSGGPDNWVKRVIAIPGDTLEGRIEDGKTVLYRNGLKVEELYVNPYPLVRIRKDVGFIPFDHVGPLSIPSFLRKQKVERNYTYDPSKSFADQPFYNMTEEEVVRKKSNNNLILSPAFSPQYMLAVDYGQSIPSMGMDGSEVLYTIDKFGPIIVPDGKYWMMGDSRKNSRDSRYWGFLDKSLIHGRASFVIYSIDSEEAFWLFDLIKHPIKFWTKHVRFNRFFKNLASYNGKTSHEKK